MRLLLTSLHEFWSDSVLSNDALPLAILLLAAKSPIRIHQVGHELARSELLPVLPMFQG